jgi:hypothetical protein
MKGSGWLQLATAQPLALRTMVVKLPTPQASSPTAMYGCLYEPCRSAGSKSSSAKPHFTSPDHGACVHVLQQTCLEHDYVIGSSGALGVQYMAGL